MKNLIQSTKFKKSISFLLAIIFFGFTIYFLIGNSDYFLGFASFICIIAGALLIIEVINTTKATPKVKEEPLDEDARWIKVCEHLIGSSFNVNLVVPILENKFTIERVNSTTEKSQYELWIEVLNFLCQIRYFGNTFDELKSKFTIKNK